MHFWKVFVFDFISFKVNLKIYFIINRHNWNVLITTN